jgi:hypothetical protein
MDELYNINKHNYNKRFSSINNLIIQDKLNPNIYTSKCDIYTIIKYINNYPYFFDYFINIFKTKYQNINIRNIKKNKIENNKYLLVGFLLDNEPEMHLTIHLDSHIENKNPVHLKYDMKPIDKDKNQNIIIFNNNKIEILNYSELNEYILESFKLLTHHIFELKHNNYYYKYIFNNIRSALNDIHKLDKNDKDEIFNKLNLENFFNISDNYTLDKIIIELCNINTNYKFLLYDELEIEIKKCEDFIIKNEIIIKSLLDELYTQMNISDNNISNKLSIIDVVYYKLSNNIYESINRTCIFEELQKYTDNINETNNNEIEEQEILDIESLTNIKTIESEMNILKKNLRLIMNKLKIYNIEEKHLVLMTKTVDTFSSIFPCNQLDIILKFKIFYINISKLYYIINYNSIEQKKKKKLLCKKLKKANKIKQINESKKEWPEKGTINIPKLNNILYSINNGKINDRTMDEITMESYMDIYQDINYSIKQNIIESILLLDNKKINTINTEKIIELCNHIINDVNILNTIDTLKHICIYYNFILSLTRLKSLLMAEYLCHTDQYYYQTEIINKFFILYYNIIIYIINNNKYNDIIVNIDIETEEKIKIDNNYNLFEIKNTSFTSDITVFICIITWNLKIEDLFRFSKNDIKLIIEFNKLVISNDKFIELKDYLYNPFIFDSTSEKYLDKISNYNDLIKDFYIYFLEIYVDDLIFERLNFEISFNFLNCYPFLKEASSLHSSLFLKEGSGVAHNTNNIDFYSLKGIKIDKNYNNKLKKIICQISELEGYYTSKDFYKILYLYESNLTKLNNFFQLANIKSMISNNPYKKDLEKIFRCNREKLNNKYSDIDDEFIKKIITCM